MSDQQPNEGTNRPVHHNHTQEGPTQEGPAQEGPETWVPAAIAAQEEHIKRWRSCMDTLGRAHTYRDFGVPSADGTIAGAAMYRACIVCGVTETREDYHIRLGG